MKVHFRAALIALIEIIPRIYQFLAQQSGDRHARYRRRVHSGIIHFRIFAKGDFHRGGEFEYQVVNPPAARLDNGKLAADNIRAAGTNVCRGNACSDGVRKGGIHRIDGINGAEHRGDGMNCLIAVVPLLPLLLLGDTHMTVRLYKTRHYQIMIHIYSHAVRRHRKLNVRGHLKDFPVLDKYASLKDVCLKFLADRITHAADCRIFQ